MHSPFYPAHFVQVCGVRSEPADPYGAPMVASDMMNVVQSVLEERLVCRLMPEAKVLRETVQVEVRRALLRQIDSRGLMSASEAGQFASRIGVRDYGTGSFAIDVSPRWVEEVDAKFQAGACERCGLFVAIPWNHEQDECDSHVVSSVIES